MNVPSTPPSEGRTWFCLDCKTLVKRVSREDCGDCECDQEDKLPEGQTTLEVE
jgi:hypothetical protein